MAATEARVAHGPSRASWATAELVITAPSSLGRRAVWTILILIAGGLVYAHLTSITITVEARGAIRTSAKIIPVKTAVAERIAVFAVKDNQRVKTGDVLAELANQVDEATLATTHGLIEQLDKVVKADGSAQVLVDAARISAELMALDIPSMVKERSDLADATNNLHQALRGLRDAPELAAADASERADARSKIAKIQREGLVIDLANELADLQRTVARLDVAVQSHYTQAAQQLRSARGALEVQIRSFEQSLQLHIKSQHVLAPADGIVSNVAVSGPGELLAAGQSLLDIIPDGGALIGEIKIANRDIAQLHVGMPVELRLDALPYQDYGTLPGHIIEIPVDATPDKQPVIDKDAAASYLVKVALDRAGLDAGGGARPVILGMTLQAEIQIRRETLLQLGIEWLGDLKDKL